MGLRRAYHKRFGRHGRFHFACLLTIVVVTYLLVPWIVNLIALERYRPIFVVLTLVFVGLAFRKLYLTRQLCATGAACAESLTLRQQRIVFWMVSVLTLGLLAVPWVVPLFY